METIKPLTTTREPEAALEQFIQSQLAQFAHLSDDEVKEARAHWQGDFDKAMTRRRVMEQTWPDAPRDCFIYASFCRPFSEYGNIKVSAVKHLQSDWTKHLPHTYIASSVPLDLPQVDLLRVSLV